MASDVNEPKNPAQNPNEAVSGWTRQVVDNLFEAEKKWLEMASQQNALVLKTIREVSTLYQAAPNSTLGDWAREGLESFVEAQRNWVENITQQQATFLSSQRGAMEQAAQSVGMGLGVGQAGASPYAEQPMEYLAEARRRWLDFASQQNAKFLQSVRESMGLGESNPAATVSEWTQQAVDNYVEVQKRWLNLATQWTFPRPFDKK